MSRFQSSTLVNAAGVPTRRNFHESSPPYDPTAEHRRCARCGARDRWQRLTADTDLVPGGWRCCTPLPDASVHGDLDHQCSPLCALGVAV